MGFKSNINYAAYEGLRQRGGEGLTRAKYVKKKEDEAEERRRVAEAKAAATRRSGQRSGLHKLGSAALRAGAAYYTGGASEALGFGGAIDDVILGTDDQGRSVRNEYGDLVRTGSALYDYKKREKAGDVAKKRASNIRDYEEQVTLAKDMGVFDPVLGKNMLEKARDTRWAQKQQTQAGEDASVWGWDNEFDELALSPAQIAGKEEANRRKAITLSDADKRAMAPSRKEVMTKYDLGRREVPDVTGEELDKGEREFRREEDIGYQNFLKGQEEDREWDRLSKEMDRPLTGADIAKGSTRRPDYELDEAWDKLSREDDIREYMKEKSAEKRLDYDPALEKTTTEFKGSPITPYKTYSEKEAEKLSREDTDKFRAGALDDIAFDTKGRALEKRGFLRSYDRLLDPKQGREDEQHFREYMLRQKAELAREHARTGGPEGYAMRKGSFYDPYESPLLKRIKARRRGSILHGD